MTNSQGDANKTDRDKDLSRLVEEAKRAGDSVAESFRRYTEMRRAYDQRIHKRRGVPAASRSYGSTG